MRHVLATLTAVACATLIAGAADDEKYTSKDGKYAIQFPAGAKVTTDTKKAAGDVDMHFATTEAAGKGYAVMYMDLPAAKGSAVKTILDDAEKGVVVKLGGKVEGSKDITSGKAKYPGREFFFVSKDGNKVKMRFVLVGTRVYGVSVGGVGDTKDFATTKDATTFLDSFEITK